MLLTGHDGWNGEQEGGNQPYQGTPRKASTETDSWRICCCDFRWMELTQGWRGGGKNAGRSKLDPPTPNHLSTTCWSGLQEPATKEKCLSFPICGGKEGLW